MNYSDQTMTTILKALCSALTDRPPAWDDLDPADWRALPALAKAEGVTALLVHRWQREGWPEQMPLTVRQMLKLGYYTTTAQSMFLHEELPRILQLLQPVGPVVLLKGAALGATLYPHRSLRPLSDLDLLVPSDTFHDALQTLYAAGYVRNQAPEIAPGIDQVLSHHVQVCGGASGNIPVELHWSMVAGAADWRSPDLGWIWQQIEPWQPRGDGAGAPDETIAWQLTPTAQLLYLSAHIMLQHGGAQARLIWLYDLHLLLTQRADDIDWDEVVACANAWRWSAAVYAALDATQRCFGTPLPAAPLAALRSGDQRAARFVRRRSSMRATSMLVIWPKLMALPVQARVRVAWRLVCPRPAYLRWRYQVPTERMLAPYYLFHWRRLLRSGLMSILHALHRRSANIS